MDTLDLTQEPYKLFNPKNIYGGVPPFELVVEIFDDPKFSDKDVYYIYPFYDSKTNSYEPVDRVELESTPEYLDVINKYRRYNNLNKTNMVPNWQTPLNMEISTDEDTDTDSSTGLSDEEMAIANQEFTDYVREAQMDDHSYSTDDYTDPLDAFRSMMMNPLTAANPADFFKQLVDSYYADNEVKITRSTKIEAPDEILKTTAEIILDQTVSSEDTKIINSATTFTDFLPSELKLTQISSVLSLCANSTKYARRMDSHANLRNFLKLSSSNFIIEPVSPKHHNKYYYRNDVDINDFIDQIYANDFEIDDVFLKIITNNYGFNDPPGSPDYRPRSPNFGFEIVSQIKDPNKFYFDLGPFRDNHTKLVKLFSFCISYLACRVNNFNFSELVHPEILSKMRISQSKKDDSFLIFRKRYNFVFFSRSYSDSVISSSKLVFK